MYGEIEVPRKICEHQILAGEAVNEMWYAMFQETIQIRKADRETGTCPDSFAAMLGRCFYI